MPGRGARIGLLKHEFELPEKIYRSGVRCHKFMAPRRTFWGREINYTLSKNVRIHVAAGVDKEKNHMVVSHYEVVAGQARKELYR